MTVGAPIGIAIGRPIGRLIGAGDNVSPVLDLNFLSDTLPAGVTFTRASSANFYNSSGVLTSAGTNVARLDYDPITLQPKGFLIEAGKTNFLLNSTTPATQTVTLGTGTYTLWVVGSGSATPAAGTAVGTGFTPATDGTPDTFTITTAGTVDVTVSGSLTRFQLENNTIPSSFITTAGASATRASDVGSLTGFTGYNLIEGTLFVEWSLMGNAQGTQKALAFTGSTNSENDLLAFNIGTLNSNMSVRSGGAASSSATAAGTPTGGTIYKQAIAYRLNDTAYAHNGVILSTGVAGAVPSVALENFGLGRRTAGSATQFLDGWIRRVRYYNTKLTNAQLQELTS